MGNKYVGKSKPTTKEGTVRCMKCQAEFLSPDVTRIRRCPACKSQSEYGRRVGRIPPQSGGVKGSD